jgi:hypothetical protein
VSIKGVGAEPVAVYQAPAYGQAGISFRVTNLDEINPVYWSDGPGVDANSSPLPAQASSVFDGSTDVWMSTLAGGPIVIIDFAPGSTSWDNPVGVQIALSNLGLATSALQQTQQATLISGVPPNVPGVKCAKIIRQAETAGVTFLGPLACPAKLWLATLAHGMSTGANFVPNAETFAQIQTTESGLVLGSTELSISAINQVADAALALPLNGLQLLAGDSVQLNVNAGATQAFMIERASATLLYTLLQPVDPAASGGKGLVGAYIKPVMFGTGTSMATAETNWASITGNPVTVRRVYWTTGANAVPPAITGPGTGSGDGQLADAANGVKNYIDFTPPYNPVSTTAFNAIQQYLASCKAAGLVADVSLWHEPLAQGLTATQFIDMWNFYAPMVSSFYPCCFNMESFNAQQNNEASYFPGTEFCAKVYVDFYAREYFDAFNIRLDAAEAVADTNGLPFGLGEFNGDTTEQTPTQLNTYFTYIQTFFTSRLSASKVNADLILFNDNEPGNQPYITSSSDIRVPFYDDIYAALAAF